MPTGPFTQLDVCVCVCVCPIGNWTLCAVRKHFTRLCFALHTPLTGSANNMLRFPQQQGQLVQSSFCTCHHFLAIHRCILEGSMHVGHCYPHVSHNTQQQTDNSTEETVKVKNDVLPSSNFPLPK